MLHLHPDTLQWRLIERESERALFPVRKFDTERIGEGATVTCSAMQRCITSYSVLLQDAAT